MRQPSDEKKAITLSSMRTSQIAKVFMILKYQIYQRKSVSSNSIYMTIENHIFDFLIMRQESRDLMFR